MTRLWVLEDRASCKPTEEIRNGGRVDTGQSEEAMQRTRWETVGVGLRSLQQRWREVVRFKRQLEGKKMIRLSSTVQFPKHF